MTDELQSAVEDYLGRLAVWNDEHGGHMIFLTAAIHLDEGSPHAHIRRVWEYQDAAGHTRLGQNKALQAAGIEPPQPGKPLGRYNNRKMSFDAMARGIWQETCREHGFDIETEARPGMRHKEKRDFIYDQMTRGNRHGSTGSDKSRRSSTRSPAEGTGSPPAGAGDRRAAHYCPGGAGSHRGAHTHPHGERGGTDAEPAPNQ